MNKFEHVQGWRSLYVGVQMHKFEHVQGSPCLVREVGLGLEGPQWNKFEQFQVVVTWGTPVNRRND